MRTTIHKSTYTLGALLLGSLTMGQARAVSLTETGAFTADAQVNTYTFTLPTTQMVNVFTTAYAGGTNLDGTMSQPGGFVPDVTIFSVATGIVVGCEGAGSSCTGMTGPTKVDPVTGIADDVNFTETLSAGNYVLALSEFPNVALGGINDGFLTSIDSTLFTDSCGAGMFLEADTASCAQRSGKFSVNVGTVPEPATLWLALPVFAFATIFRKRLGRAFGQQARMSGLPRL